MMVYTYAAQSVVEHFIEQNIHMYVYLLKSLQYKYRPRFFFFKYSILFSIVLVFFFVFARVFLGLV